MNRYDEILPITAGGTKTAPEQDTIPGRRVER